MKTVIICNKDLIAKIDDYQIFLKPLLKSKELAFCNWDMTNEGIEDTLTRLEKIVGLSLHWRAVILCPPDKMHERNPFDFTDVEYVEDADSHRKYVPHEVKVAAMKDAKNNVLTRLVTHLCEIPFTGLKYENERQRRVELDKDLIDEVKSKFMSEKDKSVEDVTISQYKTVEDIAWEEYRIESELKKILRSEILTEYQFKAELPDEVFTVALRTADGSDNFRKELNTVWREIRTNQYTQFYDWNLYFDKMRYFVYDICPSNKSDYAYEMLNFLYTLLILSQNEVPRGAVNPNLIYNIRCVNNEKRLKHLLGTYQTKIDNTKEHLSGMIKTVSLAEDDEVSDNDVEKQYMTSRRVTLIPSQDASARDFYVENSEFGLAKDCPEPGDEAVWSRRYFAARKALQRFLKQPRRSLSRGVVTLKELFLVETSDVKKLDQFQYEDILEYADNEEKLMMEQPTVDLYEMQEYLDKMEVENETMIASMKKRQIRLKALILGLSSMIFFMLAFLPMLFYYILMKVTNVPVAILSLSGVLLILISAFICLLVLYHDFKTVIKHYNDTMKGIETSINKSVQVYSDYLTHACNMSRSRQLLRYVDEHREPKADILAIYEKHMGDLVEIEDQFKIVFAQFMGELPYIDDEKSKAYSFDFKKPVDFHYEMPIDDEDESDVEFLESGSEVVLPINYIEKIEMKMEEIYA